MSTLLVAGTASHVGKSTVAAGLCRLLADRGVDVAPFKAQNMSTNARAVPRAVGVGGDEAAGVGGDEAAGVGGDESRDADGAEGRFGEIGISQYVQARAARVRPTTDHNPVLLKPEGSGRSQLVVDGVAVGSVAAGSYYDDHWERAREAVVAAHDRVAAAHDVVVAEGAGSIAEVNLHHRDLANVETARVADADILLVADIERGGVFASVVGTLELVPADLRERIVGVVITKFRGDRSILDPGIAQLEDRTGVPVLGVLPFEDPGLPEEDSVAVPEAGVVRGGAGRERRPDGADAESDTVTVVVPRLPRLSNYTDLGPLEAEGGVRVAYRPLDATIADADAVVLPGTKNTVDDLLALHETALPERLRRFDGPIVGLCGGYQLLGERLTNAAVEGAGETETVGGLGLLPVETRFSTEKRVVATTLRLDGVGPLDGAVGEVDGYEIHQGRTRATGPVETPFAPLDGEASAAVGAARGRVLGTYLHGLFENECAREAFLAGLFESRGRERPVSDHASPYDRAASLVARLDVDPLSLVTGR